MSITSFASKYAKVGRFGTPGNTSDDLVGLSTDTDTSTDDTVVRGAHGMRDYEDDSDYHDPDFKLDPALTQVHSTAQQPASTSIQRSHAHTRQRGPSFFRLELERQIDEYEASRQSSDEADADGVAPPLTHEKRTEIGAYISRPAVVPPTPADGLDTGSGFADYIWPGISMSDIARSTGLTLGAVSRIFNGKRQPRHYTLVSIANLYTEGDVSKVQALILARVGRRLKTDRRLTYDERNKLVGRLAKAGSAGSGRGGGGNR